MTEVKFFLYKRNVLCFNVDMKRRLFIGISVPQDIGKRIDRKIEPFLSLPVIWTSSENRHITVFFLGWVDDIELPEIVGKISLACQEIMAFDVNVDQVAITPKKNPDRIELMGEGNNELKDLYNHIARSLSDFVVDRRSFHPHITLGRIRRGQWKALPQEPTIVLSAHFSVPATEVLIFESTIIEGKRKYVAIERIALGK